MDDYSITMANGKEEEIKKAHLYERVTKDGVVILTFYKYVGQHRELIAEFYNPLAFMMVKNIWLTYKEDV